jgi:hypothetical protein
VIVSASYRTDIPAFHGDWFARRLAAGHALVVNPYGGKPFRIRLDVEAAQGFVFWTRNAGPFLPILCRLRNEARPFYLSFTLTGYPRALEAAVLDTERAIEQMRTLADEFGPRAVVWRYDPILYCQLTPPDWHRANFANLAGRLAGAVDEAVISFVQFYAKTRRNLATAARGQGFAWNDPPPEEKRDLARDLVSIASRHDMKLSLCAQPELLVPGAGPARCVDAGRLSAIAGRAFAAREKGNRPGCACHESRDIGAYDSCAQGCVYCYAVTSRARAQARLKTHDPAGEYLIMEPA